MQNFAWELDRDKTKVVVDDEGKNYSLTCHMEREYTTELSNIPLEAGEVLEVTMGYKVWKSLSFRRPEFKGKSE